MDFATRKKYFNRCAPFTPLEPDDDRRVDVDRYGADVGTPVRGRDWVEMLAGKFLLSDTPVCKLFTGLPGSGKTTELYRLSRLLADPNIGGNLLPVYIDASAVMDMANPIDVADIIAVIVFHAETTVAVAEGKDPEKALEDGYAKTLWNWLTRTDLAIGDKAEFNIPSAGKLVVEMKTRPTFRQQVRKAVAAHFSRFIEDARAALVQLEERARNRGKAGMIVILDSLEKLQGVTENWEKVMESAEQVFRAGAPYLRLPVHVLYTIPASLSTRIKDIDFMPVVKVRQRRGGERFEPGLQAMRDMVVKRVPEEALAALFGEGWRERLEDIILFSGGYLREVLEMTQRSLMETVFPLSEKTFQHILSEKVNEYRDIVLGEAYGWLAEISRTKDMVIKTDDQRRLADRMLLNHAVLRYLNDELWFDVHPAVREIPGVKQALGRHREDCPIHVE